MGEQPAHQESLSYRLRKAIFSDAIIVASFPLAAYLFVYSYSLGYFRTFGIPIALLSFNLTDVFTVAWALLAVVFTTYYYAYLGFGLLRESKQPRPLIARLRRVTTVAVLLLLFATLYFAHWQGWMHFLIALVMLAFFEFGLPLITQRGKGSYLEKLEAEDRRLGRAGEEKRSAQEESDDSPLEMLARLMGPELTLVILIIAGLLFITYHTGRASALRKREFYVASTSPEAVVLWIGQDRMVCAPFNRATREVEPSFLLIDIAENPDIANITFHLERVGPLSLREEAIGYVSSPLPTSSPLPLPSPSLTSSLTPTPTP